MSIVGGRAFDPNIFQLKDLHTPSHVYVIILWIGYFNSAINPVMYVLHLQDIKRVLSKYILGIRICFGRRHKSEDYELDIY